MLYLCNGLSVHMIQPLKCGEWETIRVKRINCGQAGDLLKAEKFKSYFGHVDTVKHLEHLWKIHIPVSRGICEFHKGDSLVIATIASKREWEKNPKSTTKGVKFEFYFVEYV